MRAGGGGDDGIGGIGGGGHGLRSVGWGHRREESGEFERGFVRSGRRRKKKKKKRGGRGEFGGEKLKKSRGERPSPERDWSGVGDGKGEGGAASREGLGF